MGNNIHHFLREEEKKEDIEIKKKIRKLIFRILIPNPFKYRNNKQTKISSY